MKRDEVIKLLIEAKGKEAFYRAKYYSFWSPNEAEFKEWRAKVDYLEELLESLP